MTQKEIFEATVNEYMNMYGLTIKRPYDSGYFMLYKGDNCVVAMNPDGQNLLANNFELANQLKNELL